MLPNLDTIIQNTAQLVCDNYVFKDIGDQMGSHIKIEHAKKAYVDIDDVHELCSVLTTDLRSFNHDVHVSVFYNPDQVKLITEGTQEPDPDEMEKMNKLRRYNNYSMDAVVRLPGNVAYLKFDGFEDTTGGAAETAVAVMNFMANADAIIFDVRNNGGGSPRMIQLLSTYLFKENDDSKHLNSFYHRADDKVEQFWTLPHVPGKRNPDALVYVLTSNLTFSAAEEFTYNLKNMERATIVGETTGGGAHPINWKVIHEDGLILSVPIARAINPITNDNWEGTGVEPHIEIDQSKALEVAHLHAIDALIEKGEDDFLKSLWEWDKDLVQARYNPPTVYAEDLEKFVGKYGRYTITMDDGGLLLSFGMKATMRLEPITENTFLWWERTKVKFVEKDGTVELHMNSRGQDETITMQKQ